MKEIPTAEEFVKQYQKGSDYFCITKGEAVNKLIEFAKLHVEAALESASENVGLSYKNSILNAYPENLII